MLYKRPQGVSDAFIIENTNTEKNFKNIFRKKTDLFSNWKNLPWCKNSAAFS